MYKIKLTTNSPNYPLKRQTHNGSGRLGNYQFLINDDSQECNYWIVFDGLTKSENALVTKGQCIFITGEPQSVKRYNTSFLNQFDLIVTSHRGLRHPNVIFQQQGLPWGVGFNTVTKIVSKNYDLLKKNIELTKTKGNKISIITSNKISTEGHRKRLAFVDRLKTALDSQLDIYGDGFNHVPDKWDAIAPYKYHLAIENSSFDDYWTEKIADSFLGCSFPFYYGCPNISKYFSTNSYMPIDINDFSHSLRMIQSALGRRLYENSLDALKISKNLVLDKYNLFPMLIDICERSSGSLMTERTIKPEQTFNSSLIGRFIFK